MFWLGWFIARVLLDDLVITEDRILILIRSCIEAVYEGSIRTDILLNWIS